MNKASTAESVKHADFSPRTHANGLRIVFFILVLDVLGISLLWPVTAFIVQRYSTDAVTLTILTSLYSCAQFFAAPLLGKVSDRHGRRPVLIISLLGSCIGYVMFGVGGALWVLLLSRLIDGVTAGNHAVAASFLADVSTPETRTKNFSLFGIAWGIGLILGPALGAASGQIDLSAPAWLAAALSLTAMVLGIFFLPESLPKEKRQKSALTAADFNPFISIWQIIRQPALGGLFLIIATYNFVYHGFASTEALYLLQKFGAQPWQIGVMLAVGGFLMVASFKLLPVLTVRFGARKVMMGCLLGVAGTMLAFTLAPAFNWLYPVVGLRTIAGAFLFPTIGALLAANVDPQEQGAMMGVNTALQSAMCVFGPLWAGMLYDHVTPDAAYWMGALFLLFAALYGKSLRMNAQTR
ncbi:MFS transporter [Massilia sp. W12]|uniref:MFS transporter n=1 Tax=Massilia sp. W12 TaxID=3126507 RepID=UPI0030CAF073